MEGSELASDPQILVFKYVCFSILDSTRWNDRLKDSIGYPALHYTADMILIRLILPKNPYLPT